LSNYVEEDKNCDAVRESVVVGKRSLVLAVK
jgi:hypothetical protein